MKYGYTTVSSADQMNKGVLFASENARMKAAGAEIVMIDIRAEGRDSRSQLTLLLDSIARGDTLILSKFNRLAMNALDGVALIRTLVRRGVAVDILNVGRADSSVTVGPVTSAILLEHGAFLRELQALTTGQSGKRRLANRSPLYAGMYYPTRRIRVVNH